MNRPIKPAIDLPNESKMSALTSSHAWPSYWTAAAVAGIEPDKSPAPRILSGADIWHLDPSLYLWDIWAVQADDGTLAIKDDASLWIMLSAPRADDPDSRHNCARMRLLMLRDGNWTDCGNLLPDDFSPGSREWSGSTRLNVETNEVTIWFTATGRRGQDEESFEQRIFHLSADLDWSGSLPCLKNCRALTQSVDNRGEHYADLQVSQGIPGRIKGFRDPYWFRDPANGQGYIVFTASKPANTSQSDYDGVIGIAQATDEQGIAPFNLLPALIDADGVANEMERPHIIVRDGLYYIFWSTQHHVFNPDIQQGPTGLYGMVSPALEGPYEPLNGTGLVMANPVSEPFQAYAWQVLPSLEVVGFIDYWGLEGRDFRSDPKVKRAQFGGSIAPSVFLTLSGNTSQILKS